MKEESISGQLPCGPTTRGLMLPPTRVTWLKSQAALEIGRATMDHGQETKEPELLPGKERPQSLGPEKVSLGFDGGRQRRQREKERRGQPPGQKPHKGRQGGVTLRG